MEPVPRRPCRICQRPTRGQYCFRCFAQLYPEATERAADTRHYRSMLRDAEDYAKAREADEADAPPKYRGPA